MILCTSSDELNCVSVPVYDLIISDVFITCPQTQHKQSNIDAALKQVIVKDDTDLEDYAIEISILSECKHKNIVGLHEAFLFDAKLWVTNLYG